MADTFTLSDYLQGRRNPLLDQFWSIPPSMQNSLMGPDTPGETSVGIYDKGSVQSIPPPARHPLDSLARMVGEPAYGLGQARRREFERTGELPPEPSFAELMHVLPFGPFGSVRAPIRIPNPIRAYHGSPHEIGPEGFRMDRIGTGEGAQAYGHGLYFAENEGVARSYRDALSGTQGTSTRFRVAQNIPLSLPRDPIGRFAYRELQSADGDIARAIQRVSEGEVGADRRDAVLAQLRHWQNNGFRVNPEVGHMYEVNIHARPEQFLDWDRPLSGQSASLSETLSRLGYNVANRVPQAERRLNAAYDAWVANPTEATDAAYRAANDALSAARTQTRLGIGFGRNGEAERLAEAGIPGIRYLDQQSRAGGGIGALRVRNQDGSFRWDVQDAQSPGGWRSFASEQEANAFAEANFPRTSNYVLFDPSYIEILRRYGLAGPAIGAGAYTLSGQEREPY